MADLPLAEAARYLGLSLNSIRRKVKSGELRSHRDSRGRYIVELGTEDAPVRAAPDPALRELVQLRVEVVLLREERATFMARMEHVRRYTDELLGIIREQSRQLAAKDEVIAEVVRRRETRD